MADWIEKLTLQNWKYYYDITELKQDSRASAYSYSYLTMKKREACEAGNIH